MTRLNLGCSDGFEDGYVNVDISRRIEALADKDRHIFKRVDLAQPDWPWETSSVDLIRAHDIFEHLPNVRQTMNEAHRILRPGGVLGIVVPTTDGRGAWQDPQHVSFWNVNTFLYFCEPFAEWIRFRHDYEITAHFRVMGPAAGAPQHIVYNYIEQGHQKIGQGVTKLSLKLEAIK